MNPSVLLHRVGAAALPLIHALGRGWLPYCYQHPFSAQSTSFPCSALTNSPPPPPSPNDCKGEQKSSLLSSQHPWPGGCWVLRHVPPRRWVRVAAGWVLFPAPGCRNSSSQLRRALLSAWLFARNNLWIMLVPIRLTPPGWLKGRGDGGERLMALAWH